MSAHQANLINNYPAFIDGITMALDSVNEYQVGILTTDKYTYNIPACQNDLSALTVKTGGSNSSNQQCGPFTDGYNFMTESDDLAAEFNCAAKVGTQGAGFELPMAALVEAVQEPLDKPGLCNEEYLREDSLLVAVIITDEADGEKPVLDAETQFNNPNGPETSPGGPQDWYDAIVAARGGIESNIVVLSFINYNGGACPPQSEYFNGENIKQFTELFTYGFLAGICEPDFGPAFQQAIGVIDEACDNYVSPG
jgi:hypothetical protein